MKNHEGLAHPESYERQKLRQQLESLMQIAQRGAEPGNTQQMFSIPAATIAEGLAKEMIDGRVSPPLSANEIHNLRILYEWAASSGMSAPNLRKFYEEGKA